MLNLMKNKSINNINQIKRLSIRNNFTETQMTNNNDKKADNRVRINEVGVQMINEKLRKYLFAVDKTNPHPDLVTKSKIHLENFGLNKKESSVIKDVEHIDMPKLRGDNLEEHFIKISNEQIQKYRKLISLFALNKCLPKMPTNFSFKSGWTKYDSLTDTTVQVEYPDEDALIFDVETLVLHQNCPVIAVAASSTAWYSWCSERLVQNDFMYLSALKLNDLIPMESKNSDIRKNTKRVVIGHNVGFDRSFIKEQYYLEKSGMRFLDTMSMHISCIGFTSEQRSIILNNEDPTLNLNEPIKDKFGRKVYPSYKWRGVGSLNNLKDVHEKHCPLSERIKKDARSLFVKGSPKDIIDNFQDLMLYCAKDVLATYEVFCSLISLFLERFPHPVTLAGMLEMSTMYLPVNQNWNKYLENCQNAYDDAQYILTNLLEKTANETCKFKEQATNDPWLSNLDWSFNDLSLTKSGTKAQSNTKELLKKILLNGDTLKENPFYKISSADTKEKIENLEENLKLNKITENVFLTSKALPKNVQNLYNYPNWYKELCPKMSDQNWVPKPSLITTKTRSTPSLLRLTWNGYPMYFHDKLGWGYLLPKDNSTKLNDEQANKANTKKKSKKTEIIEINGKIFQKIPHKDGNELNVGNPLAKAFLSKINEGVIKSIPELSAGLALKFYTSISYWENNEKRIRSQKVIWVNENQEKNLKGAILPLIAVAGTITRRAVEPTWLTASNYMKNRIGSELKTMIQCPNGYNLVGADVDSQELWIASTIGDSHFAKIHGSTALGWMNLQGKKSDGTDMHSKTASMIGISRDQAKVFNYGRIYGAGRSFAEKLLMQFDPTMSEKDAKLKARDMYTKTKGRRISIKADTYQDIQEDAKSDSSNKKWIDGTESEMFNKLEEIAQSDSPKTPVLGATITKTLEPCNVANEFMTSRINWVVQSSAVDYLHIMLVCMNWLIEEYQIDARFIISIHDEIRYIVKEEDSYRAALALQITNLLTRSYFSAKLGFDDLPMSVAFFSAIDIDKCLRKEPDLEFISPSNPNGLSKGYQIPKGVCVDIYQILEKTNGSLIKK